MPVHDWTHVDAGIFHAFRHSWIEELARNLNRRALPANHYALPDQNVTGLGGETDMEFYRRKATPIVVRHVSGDRVVAMIELISPGNKATRHALRSFVDKAAELLDRRIHLLIVDVLPPGRHDPHGIHAAIWEEIAGQEYTPPTGQSLTLAAYETGLTVRAYVRPITVGDPLPDMPLFLEPNGCVQVPLEATYTSAFTALPQRWRRVLEQTA